MVSGCAAACLRSSDYLAYADELSSSHSMPEIHWPQEIAGQKMETYHEWMKAVLLVSMSGCPALAVPAGFGGERNLPDGHPDHRP